jgi:DNA-binding XRE family transcriptional regulator
MKTLKSHLKEALKNRKFKGLFEEEKDLLEVSMRLLQAREQAGLSQKDLAEAAHLTQQQVSKVENGQNCNIMTYLKHPVRDTRELSWFWGPRARYYYRAICCFLAQVLDRMQGVSRTCRCSC